MVSKTSPQNLPAPNSPTPKSSETQPPTQENPVEANRPDSRILQDFSAEALAQALAKKLAITPKDWHKLSSNRSVRAREQAAAALVYMLKNQPDEAIPRLSQAIGWLDKTLKAPPCPTHAEKRRK